MAAMIMMIATTIRSSIREILFLGSSFYFRPWHTPLQVPTSRKKDTKPAPDTSPCEVLCPKSGVVRPQLHKTDLSI